ncbi:hypothetical protein EDB89DRAFT_1598124 [Lactarius sanguifluus]|nr:hypothetical protein EDB89DRAFT_1598124 [Lactarius sanguifluus]
MMVPRMTMEKDLKNQERALTDDINSLNKKVKFLEKQFNDAQSQLRDIRAETIEHCAFDMSYQTSVWFPPP